MRASVSRRHADLRGVFGAKGDVRVCCTRSHPTSSYSSRSRTAVESPATGKRADRQNQPGEPRLKDGMVAENWRTVRPLMLGMIPGRIRQVIAPVARH